MGDYLRSRVSEDLEDLGLSSSVFSGVISRCMKEPGAPSLSDIKKNVDKSTYVTIAEFVTNFPIRLKEYVRPIELAVNDFAVEVLKGLDSTLIDDSDSEIERLRGEVRKAISSIEASGDETAMSVLATQMEKLGDVSNVASPMEGVVFIYKGNAYKFTGSFAAANQILGLFKYGRKGTKL